MFRTNNTKHTKEALIRSSCGNRVSYYLTQKQYLYLPSFIKPSRAIFIYIECIGQFFMSYSNMKIELAKYCFTNIQRSL